MSRSTSVGMNMIEDCKRDETGSLIQKLRQKEVDEESCVKTCSMNWGEANSVYTDYIVSSASNGKIQAGALIFVLVGYIIELAVDCKDTQANFWSRIINYYMAYAFQECYFGNEKIPENNGGCWMDKATRIVNAQLCKVSNLSVMVINIVAAQQEVVYVASTTICGIACQLLEQNAQAVGLIYANFDVFKEMAYQDQTCVLMTKLWCTKWHLMFLKQSDFEEVVNNSGKARR
ncbi:hypothetical protein Tco_0901599 [Tanacetum coccineum]